MGDYNPRSVAKGVSLFCPVDLETQQPGTPTLTYRIVFPSGGYQEKSIQTPLSPDQVGILFSFFAGWMPVISAMEELNPFYEDYSSSQSAAIGFSGSLDAELNP